MEQSDQELKLDPDISGCVQDLYMDTTANCEGSLVILLRTAVDKRM